MPRCIWGVLRIPGATKLVPQVNETVKVIGDGGGFLAVTHNVCLGALLQSWKLQSDLCVWHAVVLGGCRRRAVNC